MKWRESNLLEWRKAQRSWVTLKTQELVGSGPQWWATDVPEVVLSQAVSPVSANQPNCHCPHTLFPQDSREILAFQVHVPEFSSVREERPVCCS